MTMQESSGESDRPILDHAEAQAGIGLHILPR